ncbi:MAG: FAD-binding oxidoreductase [Bacteroidetes bacterium]|nr:MAG: FAD-binding oxidoreductase [Bacteroidota bacterium]
MRDFNDILIVGAGLAGACAALFLSESHRVRVLEAERPAAGASGAAAGLANPFMGRRARPVWRMPEALDALHEARARADAEAAFTAAGVLRPALDARQAEPFRQTADRFPDRACWLPAPAVTERYPAVHAPHGALLVTAGGAVAVPAFVEAMLAAARKRGAEVHTGHRLRAWGEHDGIAYVDLDSGERLHAGTVLLAMGYGGLLHPALSNLHLHGVKGQTVRLRRPAGLEPLPPLSGSGYVVPDGETLVLGSSYEHTFDDLRPSPEQTRRILDQARRMVPTLPDAALVEETAGVRVGVPGTRRPLLGPLPGHRRCWIFTGLGSKGLLMAPLLARWLPRALTDPAILPLEVRVSLKPA